MLTQTLTYKCPHCGTPVEVEPRAGENIVVCPSEQCKKPFQVAVPVAEPIEPLAGEEHHDYHEPVGAHKEPANPLEHKQPAEQKPIAAPVAVRPDEQETAGQQIHLQMFRRYPLRVLAHLAAAIGGLVAMIWCLDRNYLTGAALCGVLAVVATGRFVVWWMRMRDTILTITNKRLVLETGVWSRQSTEIFFNDVQDVRVHQGILSGWFNVGDLAIIVSRGAKETVVIMAVPDPINVAGLIRSQNQPK